MTTRDITNHLKTHNSYFKWSAERLATKYNCSEKTIKTILNKLRLEKVNYLASLMK